MAKVESHFSDRFAFKCPRGSASSMILQISKKQLTVLTQETRRTRPVEACALLFGKLVETKATVERIVVTPNTLKSSVRFEIDPKAFYDAFTTAIQEGLDFIGFFHSHPAASFPSSVDLRFMKLWGDAIWLIYSSTHEQFAAFQLNNEKVEAVLLNS